MEKKLVFPEKRRNFYAPVVRAHALIVSSYPHM